MHLSFRALSCKALPVFYPPEPNPPGPPSQFILILLRLAEHTPDKLHLLMQPHRTHLERPLPFSKASMSDTVSQTERLHSARGFMQLSLLKMQHSCLARSERNVWPLLLENSTSCAVNHSFLQTDLIHSLLLTSRNFSSKQIFHQSQQNQTLLQNSALNSQD